MTGLAHACDDHAALRIADRFDRNSKGAPKSVTQGSSQGVDTATFGFLVFGTIVIIGALLFLPVAALGPLAEHLGPMPFGG